MKPDLKRQVQENLRLYMKYEKKETKYNLDLNYQFFILSLLTGIDIVIIVNIKK